MRGSVIITADGILSVRAYTVPDHRWLTALRRLGTLHPHAIRSGAPTTPTDPPCPPGRCAPTGRTAASPATFTRPNTSTSQSSPNSPTPSATSTPCSPPRPGTEPRAPTAGDSPPASSTCSPPAHPPTSSPDDQHRRTPLRPRPATTRGARPPHAGRDGSPFTGLAVLSAHAHWPYSPASGPVPGTPSAARCRTPRAQTRRTGPATARAPRLNPDQPSPDGPPRARGGPSGAPPPPPRLAAVSTWLHPPRRSVKRFGNFSASHDPLLALPRQFPAFPAGRGSTPSCGGHAVPCRCLGRGSGVVPLAPPSATVRTAENAPHDFRSCR